MLDSTTLVLGAPDPLMLVLVVFVIVVPIGLLIGAVILRAAISLFNKFAGYGDENPNQVPEPSMGKAMGIVFVTAFVNWILGLVIGVVGAAFLRSVSAPWNALIPSLISLPFSFLVSAALLSGLLPTTFPRGLGVAACQYLVSILLAIAIAVVAGIIMAALAASG
ncbi:hypothetical protein [Gimesia panareensis]|uniref:Uncharacterized protein n=1 Tax=Gimesia panareensis TaxID=2527978 RepID=A0A518ACA9_9PLAN|nr:hypothetical protein [Gimesia panareensis]QDT29324.1 hypothetical protein Enr10x_46760 [Gimesia panareensis]QDU52367.1 hypothetical protein Pan110_47440 [Gimesia panareensis]